MTIFELKEKIEETKSDIKSLEREIKRNREVLEPRNTNKVTNKKDTNIAVLSILKAEKNIQRCKNKLDDYYEEVREKEHIFNNFSEKDKQLYIDKKIYKLNNAQLEIKYGVGKRAINKKISKMEKTSK